MSFFKKMFGYHWSDIAGILLAIGLISSEKDTTGLSYIVLSYWLYVLVFLAVFVIHLWAWLLEYRGEMAYLKGSVVDVFKSYIRAVLAMLSTIGIYTLILSIQ